MTIYPPWPLKKARITTWITPEKEPHPNEKTTQVSSEYDIHRAPYVFHFPVRPLSTRNDPSVFALSFIQFSVCVSRFAIRSAEKFSAPSVSE
jgi:hypothetical protein